MNPAQSGRLELAQWLSSEKNPLASRVIVNRVWSHLFGQGIVSTVDNFGVNGDVPSHPELLDHLAGTFIADGWSVKKLIRRLVLSHSYQLSSAASPGAVAVDPGNKLLWRHSPRRLTAEEIRDAVLATAGKLQEAPREAASPIKAFAMREIRDNGPEAKQVHESANQVIYRSVYLPLLRGLTPKTLEAFDPVEQTLVSGARETTTVPSQALFLLNSTFVRQQSLALAERLLAEDQNEARRVRAAYRLTLGREPSVAELDRAANYLAAFVAAYEEEVPAVAVAAAVKTPTKKGDDPNIVDPDQADQSGVAVEEAVVSPKDARSAAWMALVQSLYASAEFRYVR